MLSGVDSYRVASFSRSSGGVANERLKVLINWFKFILLNGKSKKRNNQEHHPSPLY